MVTPEDGEPDAPMPADGDPPTPQSESAMLDRFEEMVDSGHDPMAALIETVAMPGRARPSLLARIGDRIGPFLLMRPLGAGGMGVTYLAQTDDGDVAAVKLVRPLESGFHERFDQEGQILNQLDHSAVVRYIDHGQLDDGTHWLAMEWVDGSDLEILLADLVRDEPQLDESKLWLAEVTERGPPVLATRAVRRRFLRLLAKVAHGLHHAHGAGVVHRDVKPANILVRSDLSPTLIDFGLARDLARAVSLSRSGMALGTLAYMAPEQLAADERVGPRTDVFGLGLVLFRCVTGRDFFTSVDDVLRHARRPFLLDHDSRRTLGAGVQGILYRCLEPRPERRYADAAALADDHARAAEGQKPLAAPPGWLRRFARRIPRRAIAGPGLVVMAGMLAWASWPQRSPGTPTQATTLADLAIALRGPEGRVDITAGDRLITGARIPRDLERSLAGSEIEIREADSERLLWRGTAPTEGIFVQPLPPLSDESIRKDVAEPGPDAQLALIAHRLPDTTLRIDGMEIDVPNVGWYWLPPEGAKIELVDARGAVVQRVVITDESGPRIHDVVFTPHEFEGYVARYRFDLAAVGAVTPDGMSIETTGAKKWSEHWRDPTINHETVGIRRARTALVPRAGTEAEVRIEFRFEEAVKDAWLCLRSERLADGSCRWYADDGAEQPLPPPASHAGPIQLPLSGQPVESIVLVWRMEGSTEASVGPKVLLGELFGGHDHDDPPCISLLADPDRVLTPSATIAVERVRNAAWAPHRSVDSVPVDIAGGTCIRTPDGTALVLVAELGTTPGGFSIQRRDANGGLTTLGSFTGGFAPDGIVSVGDLDGDGWEDIAVGATGGRNDPGQILLLGGRAGGPFPGSPLRAAEQPFVGSEHPDDSFGYTLAFSSGSESLIVSYPTNRGPGATDWEDRGRIELWTRQGATFDFVQAWDGEREGSNLRLLRALPNGSLLAVEHAERVRIVELLANGAKRVTGASDLASRDVDGEGVAASGVAFTIQLQDDRDADLLVFGPAATSAAGSGIHRGRLPFRGRPYKGALAVHPLGDDRFAIAGRSERGVPAVGILELRAVASSGGPTLTFRWKEIHDGAVDPDTTMALFAGPEATLWLVVNGLGLFEIRL